MADETSLDDGGEVRLSVEDGIALLVIDRAPVNAMSARMYDLLTESIHRIEVERDIKVAILTGAGSKVFCAGADTRQLAQLNGASRRQRQWTIARAFTALGQSTVPVVCAMNGAAVGGGYAIASLCDYRIIVDTGHIAMPEISHGSVTAGGAFLRRLGVREGALREILLTGRRVPADEAGRLGLVDQITSADDLMPTAQRLAGVMAVNSSDALRLTKRALVDAERHPGWEAAYISTLGLSAELGDMGGGPTA